MDPLDEIRALLEEIRDAQKQHFEAWQSANRRALENQEEAMRDVKRRMRIASIIGLLVIAGVLFAVFGLPRLKSHLPRRSYSVMELVELYGRGSGYDDFAGEELLRRGGKAKRELIRLSDDPATSSEVAESAHEILHLLFPSKESYAAIRRYINRIRDPDKQNQYKQLWETLLPRE